MTHRIECFECMLIFPIHGQQVSSLYNSTSSKDLIESTHEGCLVGFRNDYLLRFELSNNIWPQSNVHCRVWIACFGKLICMQTAIRHLEVKTEFCIRETFMIY